jgi:hypothetical protein
LPQVSALCARSARALRKIPFACARVRTGCAALRKIGRAHPDLRMRTRSPPTLRRVGETGHPCATVLRMTAVSFRSLFVRTPRTVALPPVRTVAAAAHPDERTRSLLGLSFAANALVQFAIQAWLAYSFAAPAALDAFVVNMMIVTYELRRSRMRTRVYAWAVLSLGIALQVGAAEGFALYKDWGWAARIASFAPALLLAASLHTLIIRRRETPASDGQGRDEQTSTEHQRQVDGELAEAFRHVATAAEQAAGRAPVTVRPPRPIKPPAAPPAPSGRRPQVKPSDSADVAEVRDLVAAGVSCRDAARKFGKSKRWAESHTKDIRATLRDIPPIEFHGPEIGREGASFPKGDGPSDGEMHSDLAPETRTATDLETA